MRSPAYSRKAVRIGDYLISGGLLSSGEKDESDSAVNLLSEQAVKLSAMLSETARIR